MNGWIVRGCGAALLTLGLLVPGASLAGGSHGSGESIVEAPDCADLGLAGLCSGPLYTAVKRFEAFAAADPGNPAPVQGQLTYVYELENAPSSQSFFGRLIRFDLSVPFHAASQAGFVPGGGVEPSSVEVQDTVVRFRFEVETIDPGEHSAQLFVVSPFGMGDALDSVGSNASVFTPGSCGGPVESPEAKPCVLSVWQAMELHIREHPSESWEVIKETAVALSNVFDTVEELEEALLAPLHGDPFDGHHGGPPPDVETRALAQDAALLLNLASGVLYPATRDCRLFPDTPLDRNGNGHADSTVEEALEQVEAWILSGRRWNLRRAERLARAINSGRIVL